MRVFTDDKDQTWSLAITVSSIKRVRAHLPEVNMLQPDEALWQRLAGDLLLACDVIYVLVKPQADALKISDEQFGERLGGAAIIPAVTALLEEWTDFFQRLETTAAASEATNQKPPEPPTIPRISSTGSPESSASIPVLSP